MKTQVKAADFLSIFLCAALLSACAAKKTAATQDADTDDKVSIKMDDTSKNTNQVSTINNNSLTLVDYLRRVPGLQIDQRGSIVNVMVRGVSSVGGNNSPLFVVNNSPIGTSYAEVVNAVDVNDIKTVNVIKGPEGQQMYGMRGANGVIQIFTKKK